MKKRKNSAGCASSFWERLQKGRKAFRKQICLGQTRIWWHLKKGMTVFLAGFLACICILISGCGSQKTDGKWKDGYYTAMMEEYSHGWREYVTICVMDSKIVSVEFNAKNASGFIKAWDNAYMKNMYPVTGTYPNQYTRTYAAELLEEQSGDEIDMIAGASNSGGNFRRLAAAVLECAKKGDTQIAVVAAEKEE